MSTIPQAQVVEIDGVHVNMGGNGSGAQVVHAVALDSSSGVGGAVTFNSANAVSYLSQHGWPPALQDTLISGLKKTPKRVIIVDDSGSMATADGHLLYRKGQQSKVLSCTRWEVLIMAIYDPLYPLN